MEIIGQSKMGKRDSNNKKIIDFKQLEKSFYEKAPQVLGENWQKEYASLLMCINESDSPEKRRDMQERHNSGHALTFLTFAVNSVVEETVGGNVQLRAFKTMGHLLCLREFILEEQTRKRMIVNRLFEAVCLEFPDTRKKWVSFLANHWREIRILATFYKHKECFSNAAYQKICDVEKGRKFFMFWWWQLKLRKATRKSFSAIRGLVKAG